MDVIVYDKENADHYQVCTYNGTDLSRGHWKIINQYSDFIHPNELDPGEMYQIQIISTGDQPKWFQITTANGVYASAFL